MEPHPEKLQFMVMGNDDIYTLNVEIEDVVLLISKSMISWLLQSMLVPFALRHLNNKCLYTYLKMALVRFEETGHQ